MKNASKLIGKYLEHVLILALITSESTHPNIQVEQLKQRFWQYSEICLPFSRKQQQIFTTCC